MDTAMVIDLGRQALWTAMLVCAPLLVLALALFLFGRRQRVLQRGHFSLQLFR